MLNRSDISPVIFLHLLLRRLLHSEIHIIDLASANDCSAERCYSSLSTCCHHTTSSSTYTEASQRVCGGPQAAGASFES